MVVVEVVHEIPHEVLVKSLLVDNVNICGGFPLWLAGGASFYSDIDLYPSSWESYYRWNNAFMEWGGLVRRTPETAVFSFCDTEWQLVKPNPYQLTLESILESTDLTPCACGLMLYGNNLIGVKCLYPQDVKNRTCRVLVRHDWTDYRLDVYRRKGYTIVAGE